MKRSIFALLFLFALGPSRSFAQTDPSDVGRLFSYQANVLPAGGSTSRLPLSADVLAICRPDLSDVRLYGYSDEEIPWMLDSATRLVTAEAERISQVSAPILETTTHESEGPARTPTSFHEVYEIAGPGDPPSRGQWDLVIGTVRGHFVADVRVIATASDGSEREVGHGSAFRFTGPLRERLRVPVTSPGLDTVRVEIRGHDAFLDPTMIWVASRRARAGEELVVPLEITARAHEGTQTVLTIARPQGIVPEALRFTTTTAAFVRNVHIESSEQASSDDTIWRVPGEAGIEALDVHAPAARELTITVRIDDQDSPALEALTVSAVLSRPVLVYFSEATMLRFGGGRVRAAHYDLASLQGSWAIDQLLDGSNTPADATLGPVVPSPSWTNEPALAFAQRAGVAVPVGEHRYSAGLEVRAATEGASRFVLDANVLAAARPDLADLRVVDGAGAQWPYLVRPAEDLALPVTLGAPAREGLETRYAITLPAPRVAASALRLDPIAEVVSRPVRILGFDARGDEVVLADTALARYYGSDTGPVLLSLSGARVESMWIAVSDGSETPLSFRSASLDVPTREIVLVAPPGSYRVLVGDDDAAPPVYEVESIRSLLDAITLDDATLGALAANPEHHEPSFLERTGTSTIGLWAVLVFAILVLGALTWRASREQDEPAPTPAPPAEPAEPMKEPAKEEDKTTPPKEDDEPPAAT